MNRVTATSRSLTVLGQSIDLRGGLAALWSRHRPLLGLLAFTLLLDALSTIAFMATAGVDRELNPVVRSLAGALGPVAGPIIGKLPQLVALVGLILLAPRLTRFLLATVILLNLAAFVVNMHVFGVHW